MAAGKYIWIVLLYIILFTSPHMHWSVTLCQFKAKFFQLIFFVMDVYSSIIIIHYFAWQTFKARIAQTLHGVNFENKVFLQ